MELNDCESFVKDAAERFRRFALDHGYTFDSTPKKHFWIRYPGKTEVLQGNYATSWIRGLMHDLKPDELRRLGMVVPYGSHPCGRPGHQFRIATAEDIEVVKAIIVARCG